MAAGGLAANKVLTLAFEAGDFLFQTRFFQQVGIPRQYGDIFREVHAAFVHATLVDGTHTHTVLFELADEKLFVVQQVEFVGVERFFHGVDDDVYLVTGIELGNLVAFADAAPFALLQIGWPPRTIEVMDSYTSFLRVHARTEHLRRAEKYTDTPGVHVLDHLFASRFAACCLLNETHLGGWNAVIFD